MSAAVDEATAQEVRKGVTLPFVVVDAVCGTLDRRRGVLHPRRGLSNCTDSRKYPPASPQADEDLGQQRKPRPEGDPAGSGPGAAGRRTPGPPPQPPGGQASGEKRESKWRRSLARLGHPHPEGGGGGVGSRLPASGRSHGHREAQRSGKFAKAAKVVAAARAQAAAGTQSGGSQSVRLKL
ncbi:hypothetical protein C7M84_000666 [Penaeus vannamei]|uniref:Uncharacterized protein n=1 Tax=Penaeus vannamei TaxID=6689 RepID=A0A3R7QJ88_PENVA|nr:hypothetical protein C7M84_000666 [Penaeus vannamei]